MAAVPEGATLPGEQQQVGGLPSIHAASPESLAGAFSEGLGEIGKSAQQLSDVYGQHALQSAALNNKAMSDQAYTGYLGDSGKLEAQFQEDNRNVDPANAGKVYQDYVGKLEQLRQSYHGTLTNPMAQSLFDQDSRRMQGYMIMNGSKTVASGVHSYRENAFKGAQSTLAASAAATSDPAQQEDIKQQIVTGAYAYGKTQGLPEDAIKADILQRTSAVDVSIIDQKLKTDPEGAMTYFRQHQGEMTPEHQGALQEQLTSALTMHGGVFAAQAGMAVAGQAVSASTAAAAKGGPSAAATGLVPAMHDIASGIIQAFPGTRMTSGYRTAAQDAAIGGAGDSHTSGRAADFHIPAGLTGEQFAEQIKAKFPNANVLYEGPGAHHSTAPHVHVQVGMDGMKPGSGVGQPSGYMPGTAGAQLDTIQGNAQNIFGATDQAADAYAKQWGLDPVMVRQQAEQKVEGDMNRQEYQFRQQEDSSRQNLLVALTAPGKDGEPPSDLATVFKENPGLQSDYNNLTGSDRRMVQGQLRGNANQLTSQRQQNWENVQGMDSATFLKQNPLDPALDLTTSQRMTMVGQQRALRLKVTAQQDHDAKISSVANNRLVKMGLVDAGILDTSGQVANPQDYQTFMGRMLQSEQDWSAQHPTHKGPIPDQDIVNLATPLLARRGATAPMQVFGVNVPFTGSSGERSPVIPPERYSALHDQFVSTFGYEPSPEQIGREYQHRISSGLEK